MDACMTTQCGVVVMMNGVVVVVVVVEMLTLKLDQWE